VAYKSPDIFFFAFRGQVGDELEQAAHHSRGGIKIGSDGTIRFSLASCLLMGNGYRCQVLQSSN
jgi:hypothetical protein